MSTRLLIVLLVVLVLLFAAGIGGGWLMRGQDADLSGWIETLGGRLLGTAPRLTQEDIDLALPGQCADQFAAGRLQLGAGEGCILILRRANTPVRTLTLEVAPGQIAQVRFDPAGANRFTVNLRLDADRPRANVDVYAEGGELRISCITLAAAPCLVALE